MIQHVARPLSQPLHHVAPSHPSSDDEDFITITAPSSRRSAPAPMVRSGGTRVPARAKSQAVVYGAAGFVAGASLGWVGGYFTGAVITAVRDGGLLALASAHPLSIERLPEPSQEAIAMATRWVMRAALPSGAVCGALYPGLKPADQERLRHGAATLLLGWSAGLGSALGAACVGAMLGGACDVAWDQTQPVLQDVGRKLFGVLGGVAGGVAAGYTGPALPNIACGPLLPR